MNTINTMIQSIYIKDNIELSERVAIEVIVTLVDGSKRWCYFVSKSAIGNFGDYINGTNIPVLYGSSHMVVVPQVTISVVHKFLHMIDSTGEIESVTKSV